MFAKPRILALLTILALVACPLLGADDADAATPAHVAGFFERNYVLTELIVVPVLALMMAVAMASNTGIQTIRTEHWDFWRKPLGTSYTYVPVPVEPSSPREIRKALVILGVIYLVLRFTCLFGFFNAFFKFMGGFIDILFR
jgi:hypothetical protein